MTFYLLVGIISVVGNIFVLIVVYKSKHLRHSQYVYNCSIAASDIICGFLLSCFCFNCFFKLWSFDLRDISESYDVKNIINITKDKTNVTTYNYQIESIALSRRFYDSLMYEFVLAFQLLLRLIAPVTLFVSFISLVFIAIDRYIALTFPFKYRKMNSIKIAKLTSVFLWILSVVYQTVSTFLCFRNRQNPTLLFQPLTSQFNPFNTVETDQFVTVSLLFTLIGLLWTLTLLTLCSLYKNNKRSLSLNRTTTKGLSVEKQMSFILIFMVFAFTFSLSPTIYNYICIYLFERYYFTYKTFLISVLFLSTNSIWNFFIYNILNKKFRSAFINLFFKCNK